MKYLIILLVLVSGCKSFVIDSSISAAQAGDATIIHSVDGGMLSQGYDVLRVTQGTAITQYWNIILPVSKAITSGILTIKFRDKVITKSITDVNTKVAWSQIVGATMWDASLNGIAQVTASIEYKSPTSDNNFVDVLGYAFIKVLPKVYSPLPINSGLGLWNANCKVEYTSAGRSALECEND